MKFKRLLCLILLFTISFSTICFAEKSENKELTNIEPTNITAQLNLESEAAILIEYNTGKELYSKNSDKKMYPASTTKILTAILAIENGNLEQLATVSQNAITGIPSGYSTAYLSVGEQISIDNLLKALLVHSANEAGNVIAEHISGSIEKFVELMNSKLQEIGCTSTHFVNTNGIHNDNHYSTAHDMALLTRYCMKNTKFREYVGMQKCEIPATNKYEKREYTNTNYLINPSSQNYYEYCIGGKTGFTTPAQNCLVSASTHNNLALIAVVLGATGQGTRYDDSIKLYSYGYENFAIDTIAKQGTVLTTIEINKAKKDNKNLDLILEQDIIGLINTKNTNEYNYEITLNENIEAPIAANSTLGTITYTVEGITYTANLQAANNVEKKANFMWIIYIFIVIIFLLFILSLVNRIIKKTKIKKATN